MTIESIGYMGDGAELRDAIQWVTSLAAGADDRVALSTDGASIETSHGFACASVTLPLADPHLVSASVLRSMSGAMTVEGGVTAACHDATIRLTTAHGDLRIPSKAGDVPTPPSKTDTRGSATRSARDWLRLFRWAGSAPRSAWRWGHRLTVIRIETDGAGVRLVACDGTRLLLAGVGMRADGAESPVATTHISIEAGAALHRALVSAGREPVTMRVVPSVGLLVETNGRRMVLTDRPPLGGFPDWRVVLPRKDGATFNVDAAQLARGMRLAVALGYDATTWTGDVGTLTIHGEVEDGPMLTLRHDVTDGRPIEAMLLPARLMRDTLTNASGRVTVCVESACSPVALRFDDGRCALIMPRRRLDRR